jgi:CheY-like chemotaxis protein
VDDEEISRQAVCAALQKVQMRSVAVADPELALSLVEHNDFELALLDVNMPGMDGMTLCHRMRALPRGQVTQVIFVTAINDFEKIASSNLLEKNEIIGKPFPLIELAVKALTYILKDAPVRERVPEPTRVPEPMRVEKEDVQLSHF